MNAGLGTSAFGDKSACNKSIRRGQARLGEPEAGSNPNAINAIEGWSLVRPATCAI
jgi:hypothetical protein